MTAKDLKNALLQEAVQGKLVPQIPSEGNARDLLDQIKKEKAKLIKEGKLKKEKPLPPITDEEKPFEIPENWCWCRFEDATLYSTDYIANGSFASTRDNVKFYKEKNYALLVKTQDFSNNFAFDLTYTDEHGYNFLRKSHLFGGELLLSNIGASIGKALIVPELDMPMAIAPNAIMVKCLNHIMTKFIQIVMLSFYGQNVLKEFTAGTAMPKFSKTQLRNCIIPLPPFFEQKRIVDVIEKAMPLIADYEEKENRLTILNSEIAQKIKNAILQEAIQGKLVPQNPADGDAITLLEQIRKEQIKKGRHNGPYRKYFEVTDKEKQFEIPINWIWCKMGEILNVLGGVSYDKKDVTKTGYRILRGGNIQQMKILFNQDDIFLPESYKDEDKLVRKGDILIVASSGSKAVIGKAGYVDRDMPNTMIGAFLRICRPKFLGLVGYLRCLFESEFYRKHIRGLAQGTNINNVKESYITEYVIPLPPLTEQHKICTQIESLFNVLNKGIFQ